VVVATAVNGRRVEIGERGWVSTETADGRKLLQHIDAILQVIYAVRPPPMPGLCECIAAAASPGD
jgi:hypothetical protein